MYQEDIHLSSLVNSNAFQGSSAQNDVPFHGKVCSLGCSSPPIQTFQNVHESAYLISSTSNIASAPLQQMASQDVPMSMSLPLSSSRKRKEHPFPSNMDHYSHPEAPFTERTSAMDGKNEYSYSPLLHRLSGNNMKVSRGEERGNGSVSKQESSSTDGNLSSWSTIGSLMNMCSSYKKLSPNGSSNGYNGSNGSTNSNPSSDSDTSISNSSYVHVHGRTNGQHIPKHYNSSLSSSFYNSSSSESNSDMCNNNNHNNNQQNLQILSTWRYSNYSGSNDEHFHSAKTPLELKREKEEKKNQQEQRQQQIQQQQLHQNNIDTINYQNKNQNTILNYQNTNFQEDNTNYQEIDLNLSNESSSPTWMTDFSQLISSEIMPPCL